ncbi:MAG TPA: hypothetical protein ENG01_00125, partial [Candidatus Aenigmarchaeota archaeon]|nr:hypothetical protein [Candidatus Aenigmarchaeota archaeon]HEX32808.1 hypothetical protein [Candidatus Aenigmarchaeota archaeon]
EPHKPEIDKIKVKCEKCGKLMTRTPDVLDVWIDSGVAPWATNKQYKLPYDIIIEGKDQIRGWFYSLMALSVITHGKRAYDTVYSHGFTLDEKGRGMSKSSGNGIPPEEIINKYSADTLRMYYIIKESPGEDIKFVDKEIRNAHRLLTIIKNAVKFIAENMEIENYKHKKPKPRRPEDKWIMSRINNVADKMTNYMENYLLSKAGREIINFLVEDLSRFYMKLIKDRLYIGDKNEKQEVLSILDYVIKKALVLMSPFLPITSESSYQLLKKCIGEKKLSVHMLDWVKPEEIDTELEENMTVARKLIQDILSLREKTDYNLRWPMPQVMIITTNKHIKSAVSELADIVAEQTNVKSVVLSEEEPDFVTKEVKLDYKIAGKQFGEKFPIVARKIIEISPESIIREIEKGEIRINEEGNEFVINKSDIIIESKAPKGWLSLSTKDYTLLLNTELNDNLLNEGYAREIVRRIQDLRKEKGLRKDEHITVGIQSDVNTVVRKFKSMIEKRTNSEIIIANVKDMKEYKIRDKIVKVGVVDGKH